MTLSITPGFVEQVAFLLSIANVAIVATVVIRLEQLKRSGALPPGLSTFSSRKFDPAPDASLWERLGVYRQLPRALWLAGFLFGSQHRRIGDRGLTSLVYLCRALLFLLVVLAILQLART